MRSLARVPQPPNTLCHIFRAGSSLVLDIDDCCLGDHGVLQLAEALGEAPLTEILLGENNFASQGSGVVADVLARGRLTRLDLGFNMLGDEGVIALMKGCDAPTKLAHLSLRDNEIYVEGVKALAKGLVSGCPGLVTLNLRP